jgi:hypothetical protein
MPQQLNSAYGPITTALTGNAHETYRDGLAGTPGESFRELDDRFPVLGHVEQPHNELLRDAEGVNLGEHFANGFSKA